MHDPNKGAKLEAKVVEADEALSTAREKCESIADAIHSEAGDFQRRAGADFSKGLKVRSPRVIARHVSSLARHVPIHVPRVITPHPRGKCYHALATWQEYVRGQIAFESAQQRQWAALLDVFENIPTVPLTQP